MVRFWTFARIAPFMIGHSPNSWAEPAFPRPNRSLNGISSKDCHFWNRSFFLVDLSWPREVQLDRRRMRYYLPGWYGIGSALKGLQESDPAGFCQVVDLRKTSPFLRFVLTNAETNLSSAERTIMEKYATLCPSEELVSAVFTRIMEEFDLAQSMLKEVLGGDSASRRPRFTMTHQIRADALLALHTQ